MLGNFQGAVFRSNQTDEIPWANNVYCNKATNSHDVHKATYVMLDV